MIVKLGNKSIEVIAGDITDYDGDAIVNAANNYFWMGGGVAGAIKRKGGLVIEKEAMSQGPKLVGDAVITGGGDLKTRSVIHAAVMGQDLQTDEVKIEKATLSSLRLAETQNIKSIAFPALGTGVGGFPMAEAAKIMITAARDFLASSLSVDHVTFVLFDQSGYRAFAKVAEDVRK